MNLCDICILSVKLSLFLYDFLVCTLLVIRLIYGSTSRDVMFLTNALLIIPYSTGLKINDLFKVSHELKKMYKLKRQNIFIFIE
jgi:hypothetical protein